jgi:hypothetical protein
MAAAAVVEPPVVVPPVVVPPIVVAPPVVLPPVIQEPPVATSDLDRVLDFVSKNIEDFKLAVRVLGLSRGEPVGSVSVLPPVTAPAPAKTEPAASAKLAPVDKTAVAASASAGLTAGALMQAGTLGTPFGLGTDPSLAGTLSVLIPAATTLVASMGGWGAVVPMIAAAFSAKK